MGGDFIGSDLVQLHTGYDFLAAVVETALGHAPHGLPGDDEAASSLAAGIRFVFDQRDLRVLEHLQRRHPQAVRHADIPDCIDHEVTDSSNRLGYALFAMPDSREVLRYLLAQDAAQVESGEGPADCSARPVGRGCENLPATQGAPDKSAPGCKGKAGGQ